MKFRNFVKRNAGKELEELTEEERDYWEHEFYVAVMYDREEEKGKNKAKGVED